MNFIFDLDGTISDPFEGITKSINYALTHLGYQEQELTQLSKYIGPPLKFAFEELLETGDETMISKAISYYRERYFSIGYKENNIYPGIASLLGELKIAGHKLFIATSKRKDIATNVIQYLDLDDYFNNIYGCDINLSKAELICELLKKEALKPNEAAMIGDRKFDIEAGRQNNLETIGVLWGYGDQQELQDAEASKIVSNVGMLRELLLR